jgi:hypothetical protein
MRYLILCAFALLASNASAGPNKVTSKVLYERATVGTSTLAATSTADKKVWGWSICHEVASPAAYIALSENADPLLDGLRIVPDSCWECPDCGFGPLNRLKVKAQAAGANYTIVQRIGGR